MNKKRNKKKLPLAARPEFEDVLRNAERANINALLAIKDLRARKIIGELRDVDPIERKNRLVEIAIEHPELMKAIQAYEKRNREK